MPDIASLDPEAFCDWLVQRGIRRFWIAWDDAEQRVRASHDALEPLAELFGSDKRDFDRHEGVFVQIAPQSRVLQGAFVHRTCRGQGAGGVRFWNYETVEGYLRDGLRLARGMTHKNALAGLWWGGGKGVMARGTGRHGVSPAADGLRRLIYREYGEFLTSLRGCYVTAEDAGTTVVDMAAVYHATRFTTCVPAELGGSGNPSIPTARGVVCAMQAALAHTGRGDLTGKTVVVQGLGNVGAPLVGFLCEAGVARVVGSDIDEARIDALFEQYEDSESFDLELHVTDADNFDILAEPGDVLAPCASGGVLNATTIPTIQAGIVCGAANNQLEDPARDDAALHARGIVYVPDFLANRMGIVNCADEQYGNLDADAQFERHLGDDWGGSIANVTRRVLVESEKTGTPPGAVALALAEDLSRVEHPIWGHRSARIIAAVRASDWADG